LGKPFAHEEYLSELTALREQLKAALSGGNAGTDDDEGPSTFGLADKIKTLKAGNTIEVTPQRVRQKHSIAEEPVTARIRRLSEANTTSSQAIHAAVTPSSKGTYSPSEPMAQELSENSPLKFLERINLVRRHKDDRQTPP
jgi:hypothetical protein